MVNGTFFNVCSCKQGPFVYYVTQLGGREGVGLGVTLSHKPQVISSNKRYGGGRRVKKLRKLR